MKEKLQHFFNKLTQKFKKTNQEDNEDITIDLPDEQNEDHTQDINFTDPDLKITDKINHYLQRSKDHLTKFKVKELQKPSKDKNLNIKLQQVINQLQLRKAADSLLKESSRPKIHRVFQGTVLIMFVYVLGASIGQVLKGTSDYSLNKTANKNFETQKLLSASDINRLKTAELFKTDTVEVEDNAEKQVKKKEIAFCETADQESSLPIKLINTVVLQDSVKSIASVQIRSSELQEIRVGEKIDNMAKIDKIERLRLIVKNLKNGNCEAIQNRDALEDNASRNPINVLSKSESKAFTKRSKQISGIKNDGNNFEIKKDFLNQKMSNISDLLTQARGIPIKNPDGTMSFKIVDIQPSGIFAYLGIQENDIITQIDGRKINDLNQVMTKFGNVSSLSKLNLTIKRAGSEVEQNYSIK